MREALVGASLGVAVFAIGGDLKDVAAFLGVLLVLRIVVAIWLPRPPAE
mgnify:CR=1 FL=1